MLNIEEINNTITELENADTTFATCDKLASLYIVRDNLLNKNNLIMDNVEEELEDILPAYKEFVKYKKKFQLDEISKEVMLKYMSNLTNEIFEFIQVIYQNTSSDEERDLLNIMIEQLGTL